MRRRYHPRRKFPFLWKLILFLMVSFLVGLFFAETLLRPVFTEIAEAQANRLATTVINSAVKSKAAEISYSELVSFEQDDRGRVILMQPNIPRINSLSTEIVEEVEKKLYRIEREKVKLPLFHLFGARVLAGLGPSIGLDMVPYGFVNPPVVDDVFESVGINQIRHRIYIDFSTSIKVIVPFMSRMVEVNYKVPVTEVAIMGEVPEVYVKLDHGLLSEIPIID